MSDERPSLMNVNDFGAFDEFPDQRLEEIRCETMKDNCAQTLIDLITDGWPKKDEVDTELRQYYPLRDTLSVVDGFIVRGEAIWIPKMLRKDMLQKLHKAHMGYDSMYRRARGTIFWPGMNGEIKTFVKNCVSCEDRKPNVTKEKLHQHNDGKGPWDKIGTDLFEIDKRSYLLTIDYYTNYIEIDYLSTTTSSQVIDKLKK